MARENRSGMAKRRYVSPQRAAAAAETRQRIIEAATQILREGNIAAFSLDAVSRVAGVTRLTVYNQFGSRRGLLEAVFDEIALAGGLPRLKEAISNPDARAGLDQLIQIFCDFWGSDPAVGRLHDAMGLDEEFALALRERNERRRRGIRTLIERIESGSAHDTERDEAIDLIFALTSCATYRSLASARSPAAVAKMIRQASADIIGRLTAPHRPE
jgi:AcrR family transcriptional regulator